MIAILFVTKVMLVQCLHCQTEGNVVAFKLPNLGETCGMSGGRVRGMIASVRAPPVRGSSNVIEHRASRSKA